MPERTAFRRRGIGDFRCPTRRGFVVAALVVLVASVALIGQSPLAGAARARAVERRTDEARPVDARFFEPGACMEYPPTSGDRHLTVFLDAGHGGLDPGGVGEDQNGTTVYEANETLPVELDTMALLRARGFTVVASRTGNETVSRPQPDDLDQGLFTAQGVHDDVAARDACANMSKANVLVGIYFDAGGSSYDAGCVTAYDTVRPFSPQNLKLATLMQSDVQGAMNAQGWGIPNLGVTDDSQLGVGGRLWTPPVARSRRPRLVLHAERHARVLDRAAVHYRPVRGEHRREHVGPAGHRQRPRAGRRAVLRAARHEGGEDSERLRPTDEASRDRLSPRHRASFEEPSGLVGAHPRHRQRIAERIHSCEWDCNGSPRVPVRTSMQLVSSFPRCRRTGVADGARFLPRAERVVVPRGALTAARHPLGKSLSAQVKWI
jgi:N-acetylmuramoyl-L-alanine amidase